MNPSDNKKPFSQRHEIWFFLFFYLGLLAAVEIIYIISQHLKIIVY